ncbi:hypothetical protein KJ059_16060 [Myxococcota bacterium]|nr:hypothetical protein [Myxococcota bacterium]MCZ7618120.1 hypothetical protein [Myxococcota bacterium]
MRTMNLSEDDLELLLDVLETACEAVASDFELLETGNVAAETDEQLVLDEGQTEALEWLQRVIELRDKIETQSVLGGPLRED